MKKSSMAVDQIATNAIQLLMHPDRRLQARSVPSDATRHIEPHLHWEDDRLIGVGPLQGDELVAVCHDSLNGHAALDHRLSVDGDRPCILLVSFNSLVPQIGAPAHWLLVRIHACEDHQDSRCRDLASRYRLTRTQSRILAALVEGLDPQTIARQHRISLPTVRTHLQHLREKLGCHKTSELILRVLDPAQAAMVASDQTASANPKNHQK